MGAGAADGKVVGLLVGMEDAFPQPFLDMVNERGRADGVRAELARIGGERDIAEARYAVIIDRISHEVPFYRTYLKSAALHGTVVINDPFWWEADEKFFEATLAQKLGVAHPRTVMVPNNQFIPDIDREKSLRNYTAPDWEAMTGYTGLPAVLKPNTGGGWKDVYIVHSIDEAIAAWEKTGLKQMILQEFIEWDDYVRCICIGRQNVLPLRYNPKLEGYSRYEIDKPVEGELRERVISDSRKLCEALGYDMDTLEWAVRDGVPYAIDFLNPAPDFNVRSIKDEAFNWVLNQMTDLALAYALGEQLPPWKGEHRWWRYVSSS